MHNQNTLAFEFDSELYVLLYCLTTCACLDGSYDDHERSFLTAYAAVHLASKTPPEGGPVPPGVWARRADDLCAQVSRDIQAGADGEDALRRCEGIFRMLDPEEQRLLLAKLKALLARDDVEHPAKVAFYAALEKVAGSSQDDLSGGPEGSRLRVTFHNLVHRVILNCDGVLDAAGSAVLEEALLPCFQGRDGLRLLLDLDGVTEVTNAGVRALAGLAGQASAAGVDLRVSNPRPNVRRVFALTGLTPLLTGARVTGTSGALASETTAPPLATHVETLLRSFPSPHSDRAQDAYLMFTLFRGVDQIDSLKKDGHLLLGKWKELDFEKARSYRIADAPATLEDTIRDIASYLEGQRMPGHPSFQLNVIPPPTIASVAGYLFAGLHNPNLVWDDYCHRLAEAEVEAVSAVADLVGYDPAKVGGIFTFGGTATLLYGVRIGLEKALPGTMTGGLRSGFRVVTSDRGHYSSMTVMGWLGGGTNNLVRVATDDDNSMRLDALELTLRRMIESGERIATIIATVGTTDAFGIDNVEHTVRLRDALVEEYRLDYRPHVHADAVIGWAFSVFNTYDFERNPLGFDGRTLQCLRDTRALVKHLHMADSIGIDCHKTGYAPYTSSMFLCKDGKDLHKLARDLDDMPYLFQHGHYHPGKFTLEVSRPGGSVLSALANLKSLGRQGYQVLLGHAVAMAEHLRDQIEQCPSLVNLNDYNLGPVSLFRLYPKGVDAKKAYREELSDPEMRDRLRRHNDYNHRILAWILAQSQEHGGPVLGESSHYRTTTYGEPVLCLKSYVLSPFITEEIMQTTVRMLLRAQDAVSG
ncbi:hypothetical protein BE17_47480 [Sorangium cellulosum]|uniref:STAS domain-containing protein n=1 Tax=Sorangium cellulosum TaxID=56 RepID=A0A150SJX5_SORCE|nr:hypothetical protein BE17_47480 [Sorangium cellulosum]